jgi:hypothetical protein
MAIHIPAAIRSCACRRGDMAARGTGAAICADAADRRAHEYRLR